MSSHRINPQIKIWGIEKIAVLTQQRCHYLQIMISTHGYLKSQLVKHPPPNDPYYRKSASISTLVLYF